MSTPMRASKALFVAIIFSVALAWLACSTSPPAHEGECNSDGDCPDEKPFCIDNFCTDGSGPNGPDLPPCEDDEDCDEGFECDEDGFCKEIEVEPGCETAYDCEPGQVCKGGECLPFDENVACMSPQDCPADHDCNMGLCEGCFNNVFCTESPAGPKCATTDEEPVPAGYCYTECGPDVADCPDGFKCDLGRRGLCIPACDDRDDCETGLICTDEGTCGPCTDNDQCSPQVCNQGVCVEADTGCTDAECKQIGAAHYCGERGFCQLGCTTHSDCAGLDEPDDCNPCPGGVMCDTATGYCDGYGPCDCAALDCGTYGELCDASICECITPPGEPGARGAPCGSTSDCQHGLTCDDGGIMGGGGAKTCEYVCAPETGCVCPVGACPMGGMLCSMMGISEGACQ